MFSQSASYFIVFNKDFIYLLLTERPCKAFLGQPTSLLVTTHQYSLLPYEVILILDMFNDDGGVIYEKDKHYIWL